jgi:hypothetical protein
MSGPTTADGEPHPCCAPSSGRWAGIRPFIVNLTDGQFSQTGRMQSCRHDVDAIFDVHLPAFLDEAARVSGDRPVPLVIWAHGGVVSETKGLTIAENQVQWWRANGVYPLHFVWETGFLETARQVFGRRARHRLSSDPALRAALQADPSTGREPVDAALPATSTRSGWPARPVLEVPEYNGPYAARPWAALKQSAAAASAPDGGARYVAERLAQFCQEHRTPSGEPGVSLHAVGHSAGAIFHADFLPMARQQQVPGFSSLQLLAPAVRVDDFRSAILSLVDQDIRRVTVFTMNSTAEDADTCFRFYRHSLLSLISRRFEPEENAPILGLERSIRSDPDLLAAFGLNGHRGVADIVFSPTPKGAPPDCRSLAISHGGFDDDPATMNSVARRILGRFDIARFPVREGPGSRR